MVCAILLMLCHNTHTHTHTGVSGLKQHRQSRRSESGCVEEYLVEFSHARHKCFWEWVYADKLTGCEAFMVEEEDEEEQ
jgi:hypothetical protein